MKPTLILLSCACCLLPLAVPAAVPLTWTVETSRATPAQFEAYQGETLAFEAALQSHGKPLEMSGLAAFFWQTNGMGSAYWQTSAAVNSNRLSAVFTPEMDVGARVYNCFIGSPSNIYHAAFQLRLRPSPGAIPNVLPLPVPILDFAKVRVLNPPWPTRGFDTNAVIDIIHETVDGAARPLPKYLHALDFDDTYPADAEWYYSQPQDYGFCSSVRDGGFLYRNYDWKFDDAAEFVIRMSAGPNRFASAGVANVGTNLTEEIVTSGKPSRYYKCLPGRVVDGINENGVVAEINVVDGDVDYWDNPDGDIHPLGAIRWVLDHATNALHAATELSKRIKFPEGWTQNFHWMIADKDATYIVEDGTNYLVTGKAVMTNFRLYPAPVFGPGWERYKLLSTNATANIKDVWFTRAYSPDTDWVSEFADREEMNAAKIAWDNGKGKESHRGEHIGNKWWWQSVHTSIYNLTDLTLKIAVQETDDWYTFAVPVTSGVKVETDPTVPAWAKAANPPPSMTAEEAAEIANNAIVTNAATTNLTAKLAGKLDRGEKVALSAVTNAQGSAVTAADVGALSTATGGVVQASIEVYDWLIVSESGSSPYATLDRFALWFNDGSDYQGGLMYENYEMYAYGYKWNFAGNIFASGIFGTEGNRLYLGSGTRSGSIYIGDAEEIDDDAIHLTGGHSIFFDRDDENLDERIARLAPVKPNTVTNLVNAAVSANLNTYIDGETGVEYVGKFYGGSLYYVPTGNVYPPNN